MSKSKASSMKSHLTTSNSVSDHRPSSIVNMDSLTLSHDNSVSAVLIYCKHKVLSPYFRLTSFLGWRPLLSHQSPPPSSSSSSPASPNSTTGQSIDPSTSSTNISTESAKSFTTLISFVQLLINWSINLINFIYTLLILLLIFSAYFLSYCTCYRGDGLPHLLPLIISNNSTINTNNQGNNLNHLMDTNSFTHGIDYNSTLNQSEPIKVIKVLTEATSTINDNNNNHHGNGIELINNSNTCNNKLISHFIIPDLLHFASYLFLLYLLRTPECERLENLMERGFLQLSRTANWFLESRHLISTLRSFLLLSTLWIICSIILHIIHFNVTLVNFNCLPNSFGVNLSINSSSTLSPFHGEMNNNSSTSSNSIITDYLLNHKLFNVNHVHTIIIYITVTCLIVFDIICSAVVSSYAVHCQLNISFINSLCQGVREKRISFQEFYQRAEESRKFVSYLNNNQAICVSLVSIVFICKICLYSFQLVSRYNNYVNYTLLILSAILWIIILLIPMIQAVRLTGSCCMLRNLGHELKARPFGYQHTDESELNSLLAYTSSLDMMAKLFNLPIKSSSIVLIFTLILIGVPLLGQIGVISL
ncbi:uncharacterized protein LOC128391213 [Panonychus citri]|uniref:uncharacterized protein LOC128391213 n=1 Tax=Panonychus citri TaxID=50023 RepID=UPI00230767BE|nr:uncharacterized protein LOC128391213 [Panonychus citri]